jgi:hypothetical protein
VKVPFSSYLPTALITNIFTHLHIPDIFIVSLVDKALLSLSRSAVVWEPLYDKMFCFNKEQLNTLFCEGGLVEKDVGSVDMLMKDYFKLCSVVGHLSCSTCCESILAPVLPQIMRPTKYDDFTIPRNIGTICKAVPRKRRKKRVYNSDRPTGLQLVWDKIAEPCGDLLCIKCSCTCDCKSQYCKAAIRRSSGLITDDEDSGNEDDIISLVTRIDSGVIFLLHTQIYFSLLKY